MKPLAVTSTGSHPCLDAPQPRWWGDSARRLGITRWASPPPAPGWRVYALAMLAGDLGLLMVAFDLGWIRIPW